jgi:hypothetical protein
MKYILPTLIMVFATFGVAAIMYLQWRNGVYSALTTWWRGASRLLRCAVIAFFVTAVVYGADKLLGGHIGEGLRSVGGAVAALCTNVFNAAEQQTGYAVS